jgi:hypothetical protein
MTSQQGMHLPAGRSQLPDEALYVGLVQQPLMVFLYQFKIPAARRRCSPSKLSGVVVYSLHLH